MNNKRVELLRKILQKSAIEKIAQEVVQQPQVDGEKVAEDVLNQILNSITIEELESGV